MNKSLESVVPLQRKTLKTAVYQQLCDLILEGRLAPGESITVASIAHALQVSPMPVREAISRMTAANILTVVSGRSIGVPELDRPTFEDLRNVRVEIEVLALKWAMQNLTPAFIQDIEAILETMVASEQADEVQDFIQANYNFHFAIYRQAGSPILLDVISNLWLRITPYFHLLSELGHLRISNAQHRTIVSAIKEGDMALASDALYQDIDSTYDTLVLALFDGSLPA